MKKSAKENIKKTTIKKETAFCSAVAIHTAVVDELKAKMPAGEEFNLLADFFKVFSDDTRLKILWGLSEAELCVCDVADLLGMTKSAVSHHLSYLRKSRLVNYRREGKVVYYSLSDGHIKHIFEAGREHINE